MLIVIVNSSKKQVPLRFYCFSLTGFLRVEPGFIVVEHPRKAMMEQKQLILNDPTFFDENQINEIRVALFNETKSMIKKVALRHSVFWQPLKGNTHGHL